MKKSVSLGSILFLAFFCSLSLQAAVDLNSKPKWQGAVVTAGFALVGSGVPVSHCHVLTNEHVIRYNKHPSVAIEGGSYRSKVVSIDHQNDIALVRLDECPIKNYARLASEEPQKGDKLTSTYYRPGWNFFDRLTKSSGRFMGYRSVVTEEDKRMSSMMIDDSGPKNRASGGGVVSNKGLVSVIFGISPRSLKQRTYAVDYRALKKFLNKYNIQ